VCVVGVIPWGLVCVIPWDLVCAVDHIADDDELGDASCL